MIEQLLKIRNRLVARILAVNDQCPDEQHRDAMRAVVKSAADAAFLELENAVPDHATEQATGIRRQYTSK